MQFPFDKMSHEYVLRWVSRNPQSRAFRNGHSHFFTNEDHSETPQTHKTKYATVLRGSKERIYFEKRVTENNLPSYHNSPVTILCKNCS